MLIFSLTFISAVGASDLNNDTAEVDVLSEVDDTKINSDGTDVEIITNETIGIYGTDDTKLEVYVRDKDGNNVTDGVLTFVDVFGQNYTSDVKNGVASSNVFIRDTGKFNITCNYNGLNLYKNATSVLLLNVPIVVTYCNNIVATRYDDTVYFTGNMFADYSKPYSVNTGLGNNKEVTEGTITVQVNGEELGICDVDVNGNFVYIWETFRNIIGTTINFTGFYTDNLNHYKPSNFSKIFKFEYPKGTEISYTITSDNGVTLITGIVKDDNGTAVSGGEMTINDVYSIPVDTNGKFSFYLTNNPINKANYTIGFYDFGSKADITINQPLMNAIKHTELVDELIDLCKQGSPYIKFGNGNGKTVIVNAGTHGGELPAQVAAFKLIDLLATYGGDINGTIYVFPVIFPEATANNVRVFNGINLNAVASQNGSISNNFVMFARSINASGLGDFHSTRHGDRDVGITCVMGSTWPTKESELIAYYIQKETGYNADIYAEAGVPYDGAIEDYSNINHGPAITSEVLCNHRAVEYGAPEVSFNMMRAFLGYFGFDINGMMNIPYNGSNISLKFTSPYNYNASQARVKVITSIDAKAIITVYNGGKYLTATLKDAQGNPIKGSNVSTNIKSLKAKTTDKNGQVKWSTDGLVPKTYSVILTFAGNDNYLKATKKVTVKVTKATPKMTAKAKTFKTKTKIKKYTITLKTNKNKVMKNTKVTLKVKGKTYSAKTNSKGVATFKLTKLTKKGKFTATVTYKGNSYYLKVAKKVKITVK